MSRFSASDAAFTGFRLVRENFKTVAVWTAAMTVLSVISNVLTIHFFGPQLEALMAYSADNANPDPQEFAKLAGDLAPMVLWTLPYSLVLNGVVISALNRLILRPEDKGLAYLRLGGQELRQAALWLLTWIVLFGVLFSGAVLSGFLGALGGAMGGFLALLCVIGALGAMVYLSVRLSFASAVTFDTGKLTLFKSLPLTKGLFWSLFGAYLLAGVMSIIVILLVWTIVSAVALIVSGDFAATGQMLRADTTSLETYFTPAGIVQTLFSGLITVLSSLIMLGPAPSIYRALKARDETVGEGGWTAP